MAYTPKQQHGCVVRLRSSSVANNAPSHPFSQGLVLMPSFELLGPQLDAGHLPEPVAAVPAYSSSSDGCR